MKLVLSIFMKVVAVFIAITWISALVSITMYLAERGFALTFWNVFMLASNLFGSIVLTAFLCVFLWFKSEDLLT